MQEDHYVTPEQYDELCRTRGYIGDTHPRDSGLVMKGVRVSVPKSRSGKYLVRLYYEVVRPDLSEKHTSFSNVATSSS